MTNGTSQGLLVIVAVVIFGVFVAISYLLFGDKMNTGLSTIFCDSFEQTNSITKLGKINCSEDSNGDTDKEEDIEIIDDITRLGFGFETDNFSIMSYAYPRQFAKNIFLSSSSNANISPVDFKRDGSVYKATQLMHERPIFEEEVPSFLDFFDSFDSNNEHLYDEMNKDLATGLFRILYRKNNEQEVKSVKVNNVTVLSNLSKSNTVTINPKVSKIEVFEKTIETNDKFTNVVFYSSKGDRVQVKNTGESYDIVLETEPLDIEIEFTQAKSYKTKLVIVRKIPVHVVEEV